MRVKKKRSSNEKGHKSYKVREKLTGMLELPKEVLLNIPKVTMLGYKEILIENYKGIIECTENKIRINTSVGMLIIDGANMTIREISSEDVMIEGDIDKIKFLK